MPTKRGETSRKTAQDLSGRGGVSLREVSDIFERPLREKKTPMKRLPKGEGGRDSLKQKKVWIINKDANHAEKVVRGRVALEKGSFFEVRWARKAVCAPGIKRKGKSVRLVAIEVWGQGTA